MLLTISQAKKRLEELFKSRAVIEYECHDENTPPNTPISISYEREKAQVVLPITENKRYKIVYERDLDVYVHDIEDKEFLIILQNGAKEEFYTLDEIKNTWLSGLYKRDEDSYVLVPETK